MKTTNGRVLTREQLTDILKKAFGNEIIAKAFAYTAEEHDAICIMVEKWVPLTISFRADTSEIYKIIKDTSSKNVHFISQVWRDEECIHVDSLPVYDDNNPA